MSTDLPQTIKAIRRMLKDRPIEDYLTGAMVDTTTTTFTVNDIEVWAKGNVWEFADGTTSAERVYVRSTTQSSSTVTSKRGHLDSTAATHANGTVILKDPRFPYDSVAQAVNVVLDSDLYMNDIFEVVEHQVTSSATTNTYNQPTVSCKKPLNIYQRPVVTDEPIYLHNFSRQYFNADTTLYANGGYIVVRENFGNAGTDLYYVNCAHKLSISTITATQERIVQNMACYYLLTWEDIRRTAGPTNQGDRSVRPLDSTRLATFFKAEADRLITEEAAHLSEVIRGPGKNFVRLGRFS